MKYRQWIIILLCFLSADMVLGQEFSFRWLDNREFCLDDEQETARIWGAENSIPGVYFEELLPAFFKRKIVFAKSDFKTSNLKWIFTGQKGGITLTINSNTIKLEQRYYDSFGFNTVQGNKINASRYPQRRFSDFEKSMEERGIESISMEIDHALGLKLYVNGQLINAQTTQIDVSKHQLLADGNQMNVCGKLQIPQVSEVTVKIDTTTKHQRILGFGGITSPVAYHILSPEGKELWWRFLKEYNLLIQREYPTSTKLKEGYSNWDSLDEAVPHYYGDNFPNGEVSDFEYNKKVEAINGMVVFEFWNFPEWMMDTSPEKKSKEVPNYKKYAAAIVNYCKTAKQKTGKAPAIVGIQNEVTQPSEVWQELTLHLRKALDENGFNTVKIHMHNAFSLSRGIDALNAFAEKKEVWEKIDYSASNLYDFQDYFTNPDGFDKLISEWNASFDSKERKPFISTEMCINNPDYQSGSYRVAFLMGELYHKNIVDLDAVSLMYCWLLVNTVQPSFSASRSLFKIDDTRNNIPIASSYQLRVFGAFSRHLLRGTHRIDAFSSSEDLLVSAYSRQGKNIVIILNRGTADKKIDLQYLGDVNMMELVSPYRENESIPLSDKNSLIVAPGTIATLYHDLNRS